MENTERKTYSEKDFIEKFNLVMSVCNPTTRNDGTEWHKKAFHYLVRITPAYPMQCLACKYPDEKRKHEYHPTNEKAIEVTYSKGSGHVEKQAPWQKNMGMEPRPIKPTLKEVLSCLLLDARPFCEGHVSYKEWAGDYGYDEDSRKGEKVFRACEKQSLALRDLIGAEAFREMVPLYEEEC